jgi:fucose permease
MATLLLLVIYLAFISLGLPDSLLGSAWPAMRDELHEPYKYAGVIAMTIACCTLSSSLASGYTVKKLGAGFITMASCFLTAGALIGFAHAPSLGWLVVFAFPLGLGGGMVDSVLNNYVAEHYEARHMSWLHSFWGLGATVGPFIMAHYLVNSSWREGYQTVALIQVALVVILFLSLPIWSKVRRIKHELDGQSGKFANKSAVEGDKKAKAWQVKGVWLSILTFTLYCGVEATIGLWGSSYLVEIKSFAEEAGAQLVAIYFGGITIGRMISGFVTYRLTNRQMIFGGQLVMMTGVILLFAPLPTPVVYLVFLLIGLGLSPIFPSMMHETPVRFGQTHSQSIIGYHGAAASFGIIVAPPLFGWLASHFSLGLFTFYIGILAITMLLVSERLVSVVKRMNE